MKETVAVIDHAGELLETIKIAGDRPRNDITIERARIQVEPSRAARVDAKLNVLYLEKLGAGDRATPEDLIRAAKGFPLLETGLDAEADALETATAAAIAQLEREGASDDKVEAARDAAAKKCVAIWKRTLEASADLDEALKPNVQLEGADAAAALVFHAGLSDWTPKQVIARATSAAAVGSDALWSDIRGCLVRLRRSPPTHWKGMAAVLDGVLSLRGDPEGLAADAWSQGRSFAERSRRQIRAKLMRIVAM